MGRLRRVNIGELARRVGALVSDEVYSVEVSTNSMTEETESRIRIRLREEGNLPLPLAQIRHSPDYRTLIMEEVPCAYPGRFSRDEYVKILERHRGELQRVGFMLANDKPPYIDEVIYVEYL